MFLRRLVLVILSFCIFFSQTVSANPLRRRPVSLPIIDGTRVPASQYPNVAAVFPGDSICTGTLIASRFVLTAAHCFFGDNNSRSATEGNTSVILGGQTYGASRISIHPAYRSRSEACVQNELDAALIELSSEVAGITPAIMDRTPVSRGTGLLLVGFGTEGTGSAGEQDRFPPDGIVNIGNTVVENVDATYLQWEFDSGEANTAGGDSGGPSFSGQSGALVGITCGGTGNSEFGTESLNTRLDRIIDWIDSIAGTSPTPTVPQFLGPASIQAQVGAALSVDLSFSGAVPSSVQATGLPDGLSLSGRTIVGTPIAAGSFPVIIVAANEVGTSTSGLTITVTAFGATLQTRSVLLQFDYADDGEDFLIVKGKITLPAKFKPKGKRFRVQIGRFGKNCKLDSTGGCGTFDFFQLNGNISKGAFTKQTVSFELQLVNLKLFDALATLGFPDSASASAGEIVALPVEIVLDGVSYSETSNLRFRNSDERWVRVK